MNEKMYRISLMVPLGIRDGNLYLWESNGKVDGWLEVMNHRNELTGTIPKEDTIVLHGKIETLVDAVSYTATGNLCGKKIFLNLKTESGIYTITGEEVANDEKIL